LLPIAFVPSGHLRSLPLLLNLATNNVRYVLLQALDAFLAFWVPPPV